MPSFNIGHGFNFIINAADNITFSAGDASNVTITTGNTSIDFDDGEDQFLTMHDVRTQDLQDLVEKAQRVQGFDGVVPGRWFIDNAVVTCKVGFRFLSPLLRNTLASALTLPGLVRIVFRPHFDLTRLGGVRPILDNLRYRAREGEP
ncbi:CMGC/SRPK protein kinase [Pseudozyma hubeiensis SY62]|uniref:CMGC/SRPK protein kinase n=1 Tax=Pseudozyma hubeiensis (strain SY62) TaxID=1305764 RepID=R9PCZ0_PSEHS|nr:CMGC/SRPK protein kinase [Pseudozyma hubeiensis SY62]GAC99253.1 CMGC/SRPK protein kinase [Pseudozyma hubeiensis SY62]